MLQLEVRVAAGLTYTYDEVYPAPEDPTRQDGIEDAPLRIQRRATDDAVETGALSLVIKTRNFLGAAMPVAVPDPGSLGHRARLTLDGAEIYSGVVGLEDLVMEEADGDRLWEVTIRDDAAAELEARLGEVFCDQASVRGALAPIGLPTAILPTGGSRAAEADWYELFELWEAVLDVCDASYVGPAIRLRRAFTIDANGFDEDTVIESRAAVRGTGIDGAPQWTGLELVERLGELVGWRLLPRYATWPSRDIEVDAVLGYFSDDTAGLRAIPDDAASNPTHSAAAAEIPGLGIQYENFAINPAPANGPERQAIYASERLALSALGVGLNGGAEGEAMFDLGWRLPNIEVTETLLSETPRFDGGDDVRETQIGNILIEAVPTTNYLVQIGPQIIDVGSAIDTAVSSQYYYVRASGGSPIYQT
ncbi:MAG: hypothetical protein AAGN64_01810, partial [Bacteroidota bacterium]